MPDDNRTDERTKAEALGAYLRGLRASLGLSLRQVEDATDNEVSNAYLSQLENGKIAKPSPNILHSLAMVYRAPYAKLMERAGYISPLTAHGRGARHGKAATYSIENLSADEEKELLKYLAYVRTIKQRS